MFTLVISHRVQMVCWASPEAKPVAADDAKDLKWFTLPQIRKLKVSSNKFDDVL